MPPRPGYAGPVGQAELGTVGPRQRLRGEHQRSKRLDDVISKLPGHGSSVAAGRSHGSAARRYPSWCAHGARHADRRTDRPHADVSVWVDISVVSAQTDSVDREEIVAAVGSGDPCAGLRASVALHRLAERVEASQVAAARRAGWSWQQIGDALGITRQSVHAKYGKELP
jgi:hypothetical protein